MLVCHFVFFILLKGFCKIADFTTELVTVAFIYCCLKILLMFFSLTRYCHDGQHSGFTGCLFVCLPFFGFLFSALFVHIRVQNVVVVHYVAKYY